MTKNRLEAFSDGVIAIIITIMVLELKTPHGINFEHDIMPLRFVFLSYVISFVNLGIYWANHHHLVHTVSRVNSSIIWSNLVLLFFLSLMPFATAWMGESHFQPLTVAVYAVLANLCGVGYYLLLVTIRRSNRNNAELEPILKGQSKKGIISIILYLLAIPAAYVNPWISGMLFIVVGISWFLPDRNIEKKFSQPD